MGTTDGGREEFEDWARARQDQLVRAAYVLTGDFARAEDLAQEALIKVAERWNRLRTGDPYAFARRIVYRDNVSWWRRTRREIVTEAVPDVVLPPAADALPEDLLAALDRLPRQQRAVLMLRHVEDLSVRETAQILGVGEGTVKKLGNLARTRMRGLVEAAPPGDGELR